MFEIDFNSPENTEAVVKNLHKTYKNFDWIIHAAGTIHPQEPAHGQSLQEISKTLRVNAEAVVYTSEELLPFITKGGGIIFISSTAGIWGNKDFPIYSASKGGLNTYGMALARRLEGSGMSSIVIAPGPTNTPMRARIAADAMKEQSPAVVAEVIIQIINGTSSTATEIQLLCGTEKRHCTHGYRLLFEETLIDFFILLCNMSPGPLLHAFPCGSTHTCTQFCVAD